ncbi:AMP-binding protein [Pusillimonas sp. SM2304]|uniref:AMP-binding protein n=1 Tax=Pusillimonas sp. SM2304 TaxID=3073241 RepID=UPI002876C042|nr:AMP-binding protein [Pusillimonas sp. SM2304]MDS1139578.1 AMP-binding protein [Pusillimonas sp. SM2304]
MALDLSPTVTQLLQLAANAHPEARLIWAGAGTRSYKQLLDASQRCAGAMAQLGIQKGDRVAFWMPNGWAYLDFLFGALQLGAIAVAVNTRFRAAEVGAILNHTRPKALVMEPGFHDIPFGNILASIEPHCVASITTLFSCGAGGLASNVLPDVQVVPYEQALSGPVALTQPSPQDSCVIFTTSGTTSGPKFVVHNHRSVAGHAIEAASAFGYDDSDAQLLHALPFCGIFGFSQLTATIAAGASSIFMTMFEAVECARLMQESTVTHISGTDDLLKRVLDVTTQDRPFPRLRECVYAGFNPALATFPEVADVRGMRLIGCFGMSEIHSFFSRQPADAPVQERKRPGGLPVGATTKVRVRDTDTGHLLTYGEIGELEIFSRHMFSEYFDQPEATRLAFTEDGYFKTGDLGCVYNDGRYEFRGRRGDYMRLSGFQVNPLDIELVIQEIAAVNTAIVVEAPAATGTRAVAFVRLNVGQLWDEDAIRQHCIDRLANFKVPARFIQVETFPSVMGPNGEKIQRGNLKTEAAMALACTRHPQ